MSSKHSNHVLSEGREEEQVPSCFICADEKEGTPVPTPCCRQLIHESCMAAAFSAFPLRTTCPFCRAVLIPLNGDEPPPRHQEGTLFRFRQMFYRLPEQQSAHRPPSPIAPPEPPRLYFGDELDDSFSDTSGSDDELFLSPPRRRLLSAPSAVGRTTPPSVPPAGWAEFMAQNFPPRTTFSSGRPE